MKTFHWTAATAAFICSFILFLAPIQGENAVSVEGPVKAELIAKENSIQPGRPFWVAVKLEMQQGWDTYWMNPGDAGFPTQIAWELPKGFTAGPIHWPYPERFDNDSLVAFGYTEKTLLLTEITPPSSLKEGETITLVADVNWLACNDSCVPGSAHLVLDLPVSPLLSENNAYSTDFAAAERSLPKKPHEHAADLVVKGKKKQIALHLKPLLDGFGEIEDVAFIPEEGQGINYSAPQMLSRQSDGSLILNVERLEEGSSHVKGLLLLSEKGTLIKKAIRVDNSAAAGGQSLGMLSSMWVALLFAFVGGIILNVMPCVLPVIALKIFSFVKMADEKRSEIIKHGLLFSFGVVLSFWCLSGLLFILRAYGQGVGWGFQLQEPAFVAVLVSILFLLGLSLFGLFEMGTSLISLGNKSKSGSPLMGSFMSGILATLVATPCTGPLLGPAVGFAMTLPAIKGLSIFTAVGVGMAFPYLFFSFFPKFVRFLPKPGNWMITFKQVMGFLMMATVLWLLWVFTAQTDMIALFALLAALMVMAIAAWIYGKWATPISKKITRRLVTLVALCMISFSGFYALQVAKHSSNLPVVIEEGDNKIVYSPESVRALREEGKTVFVDFTAKWCLICQTNKVVLHSEEIKKTFEDKNVVFLEADWTKRDPMITEELQKLGRSGVPVYAIYPPDLGERPMILPQTLTNKVVLEYLANVKAPKTVVAND